MKYINECEAEKMFDEFIDEISPTVKILGMEYTPSLVLKEIDPTAYQCTFSDWLDSEGLTTDESEAERYPDEEEEE